MLHEPSGVRTQRAPERADDARGDGVLKTVRAADRDRHLARAQSARGSQGLIWKVLPLRTDHREVGVRILADESGRHFASIRKREVQRSTAGHDVTVGQNEAIGRHDEPGTGTTPLTRLRPRTS